LYSYDLETSYRNYKLTAQEQSQLDNLVNQQQPIEPSNGQSFFELAKKMAINLPIVEMTNQVQKLSVADLLAINQGGHYFLQLNSSLPADQKHAVNITLLRMITAGIEKGELRASEQVTRKFLWLNSSHVRREQKLQQALIDAIYPDKSKPPSKLAKGVIERLKRHNQAQMERFKAGTQQVFVGLDEVTNQVSKLREKGYGEKRPIPDTLLPSSEINHYFILRDLFLKAVQAVRPEIGFNENNLRFNLGDDENASASGKTISVNLKAKDGRIPYPERVYEMLTQKISLDELAVVLKTIMHEAAHGDENHWTEGRGTPVTHDLAFRKKEEANYRELMNLWLDPTNGEPVLFKLWRKLQEKYPISENVEPVPGEHFFNQYLKRN
jgi:hypothetical protein